MAQKLKISSPEQMEQIIKRERKERASANIVEFPQVKTLILDQLPKLTGSSSQDGASVKWLALDTIQVSKCPKIQKSMLGMVDRPLLKNISVANCPPWEYEDLENNVSHLFKFAVPSPPKRTISSLKSINEREAKKRAGAYTVEFPQVKTLILDQMPQFTGSSTHDGASLKWLALDSVQVSNCPEIQKSMLGMVDRPLLKNVTVANCVPWEYEDLENNIRYLFKFTDELSELKNLKIDSKQLKKYMEMELQESSFMQLKTVDALQCGNELSKFLSILLPRSDKLERLTVERCELLEQVFDLSEFVAEEQRNLKFPNLKTMQLRSLRNLNCIWNKDPRKIVELGKLVKLEIIECGLRKSPLSTALLEKLVRLEELKIESCKMIEQVVEDDMVMQERSFPKLKNLQLASLPKLIKFNSGHCNFRFPNLLSLRIEKCPKLNAFTAGFLSNQMLTIEGTSAHVSPNEMMHACPKLQTLKLEGLEMVEDMWPHQYLCTSILCDLEVVEVDFLSRLRYMRIARSSEKLKTLVLRNCSSLERLILPSNCFNLRNVEISGCNILKEISTNPEQENKDEKTFRHLEFIVLENLPELSSFSLETCEFPSLKELRIVNCFTLETLPRRVSTKADSLLNKHSALVLFDDVKEDSPPDKDKLKIPSQLELLALADLLNMQLWNQEPQIPVFQNLSLLKIIGCGSIEKLFSISVAQHLSSLKLLTLYKCENMVQVLQGGGGASERWLEKLETLVLKHLPRLTSFCEEDVDFSEFSELSMVRVEDVPNMYTFVKLPLNTPKLKQVHVTYIAKCWRGDLNQTIKYLHQKHDRLKDDYWKSDQSSTRHYTDAAESSSEASWRFTEIAETELQ